ncbi:MAG TPA: hypothetical protein VMD59_11355 [Acidimicrobiales bacterium]|nr:hypothetical protein [Acidimicrobiales bacterium]
MHEHSLPPSGEGSVLLDIGQDVGALVVHVLPDLDGQEIDLIPAGSCTPCTHSAVRRRDIPGGSVYAAVYPSVPAGDYVLAGCSLPVHVDGGAVTELRYVADRAQLFASGRTLGAPVPHDGGGVAGHGHGGGGANRDGLPGHRHHRLLDLAQT